MKEEFKLKLEFPGIVAFDPFNLEDFCRRHKITEPALLEFFIKNPEIGDKAIREGVILPIYTIEKANYTLQVNSEAILNGNARFRYNGFPLKIKSGKFVVSDIYALLIWDDGIVYKEMDTYDDSSSAEYAVGLASGNYSVDIIGFFESEASMGFQLVLNEVSTLSEMKQSRESYNFNVCQYIKIKDKLKVLPRKKEL